MDWLALFDDNGIDYVTRGPNTKRGEVSIQCPYCGEDDPSHHMGINLTADKWGCHRSADHRGSSPARLIKAVLGCTYDRANAIARQYSRPDPDNLTSALEALTGVTEAPKPKPAPLTLPASFKSIQSNGLTGKFYRYIEDRGFYKQLHLYPPIADTYQVIRDYRLWCALTGRYKDRIIFPFYRKNQLVGWTGRAIGAPAWAPRYLSSGPEIKTTVFNYDQIKKPGQMLAIVEGPFDAMKLDFYGQPELRATCIFGTSMTLDQIWVLNRIARNYAHVFVILDPDAIEASFAAKNWLTQKNISVEQLPEGIEDPGAMSCAQVKDFVEYLKQQVKVLKTKG